MPLAVWSTDYETGDITVDLQHQRLFGIINDLHRAIITGRGQEGMESVLVDLRAYVGQHFACEEALMTSAGYPSFPRHKAKHDELTRSAEKLSERYREGTLARPGEISEFLADWLRQHIQEEDMAMIRWVDRQHP